MKATRGFVEESFSVDKVQDKYKQAVLEIGLWESEKIVFNKYLDTSSKILDIGCGAGRTTFGLFKLGYKNIIGLDLTPKMIESAKVLQESIGSDFEFVVGDACALDFSDESFETCIFLLMASCRYHNLAIG